VCLPQFAVVDVLDPLPNARVAAVLVPAVAEVPVVEAEHLRRQPRRYVYAVGDVADRDGVFRTARIKPRPHGPRNFPMQRRDRVRAPRHAQTEHRHAEFFMLVAGVLAAERHQRVVREAHLFAQRPEVLFNQAPMKAVVPRRHWRVRREHHFARHPRQRLMKIQPLVDHAVANRFQHGKPAVPFVEMQHARRDAHRLERSETAHSQEKFLANAHAPVPAV